jgi:hypothetical protein
MSGDMTNRQAEAYRAAAGILLSSEEARGQIKDVISYRDGRNFPKLAVVHDWPMHENFFIEGDETTYDCSGFIGVILLQAFRKLHSHLRDAPVDVGCIVTSLIEDVPRELEAARAGQSRDMFSAFLGGKVFNLETGQFDVSAAARYPVTTSALTEAFKKGWDFYE